MLQMNLSRINGSVMRPLSASVASVAEGVPMVAVMENGRAVVRPSQGNATTEQFVGVSRSQTMTPTEAPKVEDFEIPTVADGVTTTTVTLAKTPTSSTDIKITKHTISSDGKTDTTAVYTLDTSPSNGVPATGKYLISGRTLTFAPGDATDANANVFLRATYRFAITLVEARMLYGEGTGDGAQSDVGGVDCINDVDVLYTDMYDPTDDWTSAVGPVYLGAGVFTLKSSTKTLIPNCYVVAAPSSVSGNNGFLGISFRR